MTMQPWTSWRPIQPLWNVARKLDRRRRRRRTVTLFDFPYEVILDICSHLDSVSLFHLSQTSRRLRALLTAQLALWQTIVVDPSIPYCPEAVEGLSQFLALTGLESEVRTARFDRSLIDFHLLHQILRPLSNLSHLSLVDCPNMDCWCILVLIKIAAEKGDGGSGFMPRLARLDMRGAFPSERHCESLGREILCYAEIKRVLLAFDRSAEPSSEEYHQPFLELSESHYTLYQFWLILRSRMITSVMTEDATDAISFSEPFWPDWLPDPLLRFIHFTENSDPHAPVQVDLVPCLLCRKNVMTNHGQQPCKMCGTFTPTPCAQCVCIQCQGALCVSCYYHHCRTLVEQPQLSWRVVCCRECLLPRRICNDESCRRSVKVDRPWSCSRCSQRRRLARWKTRFRNYRQRSRRNLVMWEIFANRAP